MDPITDVIPFTLKEVYLIITNILSSIKETLFKHLTFQNILASKNLSLDSIRDDLPKILEIIKSNNSHTDFIFVEISSTYSSGGGIFAVNGNFQTISQFLDCERKSNPFEKSSQLIHMVVKFSWINPERNTISYMKSERAVPIQALIYPDLGNILTCEGCGSNYSENTDLMILKLNPEKKPFKFQINRKIFKGERNYNLVGVEWVTKGIFFSAFRDLPSGKWITYSKQVFEEIQEDFLKILC